jgi:hypothetical protein
MSGASLGVPGVLYVGPSPEQELAVLHVGPAVGWVALKGIHTWSREVSVALKADVTDAMARELGVMLPEAMADKERLVNARRAARASTLVAVDSSLVDKLVAKGVRVHTVGSDRITGGFYYFAKGGAGEPVRLQGNLVEMVAATLAASADNATVEAALDGAIARILSELSGGLLTEAQIELAATLPALGEAAADATVKLQTLEGFLVLTMTRGSKYEDRARDVVAALDQAAGRGAQEQNVPLFGDARRDVQPALEIEYAEGESGARQKLKLPERSRWLVAGLVTETMPPPAVAPSVVEDKAAAENAAAEKAAAEKAVAEKAAAEKAAAAKVAAEKAAAENAAAEKAAAEKVAAEKAAAERAAAAKAAAERATAEKVAAEKAAAEKVAAERVAAEKAAAEKAAAEKAAAERAAAEKVAAEKAAAEKAAAEEAEAEKAAAEKAEIARVAAEKLAKETAAAAEKAAAKKADAEAAEKKAVAEKKAADKTAADKAAEKKKRASAAGERAKEQAATSQRTKSEVVKSAPAKADAKKTPMWIWLALLFVAAGGAYYLAFVRGHG